MFIAALFTIAKTWKQPKCPLADEWIKKMWDAYTHTHMHTHERKCTQRVNSSCLRKLTTAVHVPVCTCLFLQDGCTLCFAPFFISLVIYGKTIPPSILFFHSSRSPTCPSSRCSRTRWAQPLPLDALGFQFWPFCKPWVMLFRAAVDTDRPSCNFAFL